MNIFNQLVRISRRSLWILDDSLIAVVSTVNRITRSAAAQVIISRICRRRTTLWPVIRGWISIPITTNGITSRRRIFGRLNGIWKFVVTRRIRWCRWRWSQCICYTFTCILWLVICCSSIVIDVVVVVVVDAIPAEDRFEGLKSDFCEVPHEK